MNINYNHSFGQNTGLWKKLDMTHKQKESSQIAHDNKKNLQTKRQKVPRKVVEEASGCVRPEVGQQEAQLHDNQLHNDDDDDDDDDSLHNSPVFPHVNAPE